MNCNFKTSMLLGFCFFFGGGGGVGDYFFPFFMQQTGLITYSKCMHTSLTKVVLDNVNACLRLARHNNN